LIPFGCYDKLDSTCFPGGTLCKKPLVACFDVNYPQPEAQCIDIETDQWIYESKQKQTQYTKNYCDVLVAEFLKKKEDSLITIT